MITESLPTGAAIPFAVPESRWDDAVAAALSPEELLLYRSNLLGSDLTVTNFGGGNTSAKLAGVDPLTGEAVAVLWVKGSGGDIGSMTLDGFATLYQDKLLGLEKHYGGPDDDDKMVGYLPHCTFALNGRAASIDTPLHSLLPFAHVDHVHPDAIIALAASSGGEAATQAIWGGRIGWLASESALLYITGGAGWLDTTFDGRVGPDSRSKSASETLFGWVVGGGIEAAVTPNIHLKAEYLYGAFDDGEYDLTIPQCSPKCVVDMNVDDLHTFRVGLSYNFTGMSW